MNRLHLLILVVLVSVGFTATAQKTMRVKTNPLSIFNAVRGPNINFSFEHGIKKTNWTLEYQAALHYPKNLMGWKNLRGGFGMFQVRRYVIRNEAFFVGANLMGGYQTFQSTDSLTCDACGSVTYDSELSWLELSANVGAVHVETWGGLLEVFFSVGGRFYNNNISLSDEIAGLRHLGDWTVPRNYRQKKGVNFDPKITMTVRLGMDLLYSSFRPSSKSAL